MDVLNEVEVERKEKNQAKRLLGEAEQALRDKAEVEKEKAEAEYKVRHSDRIQPSLERPNKKSNTLKLHTI